MPDSATSSAQTARSRATERDLGRLSVSSVPKGWKLSSVGESCAIRNDLRLPLSVEKRSTMQGEYPYFGPTGVLDHLNEFRAEGEFALIGEDGDHFLDTKKKRQTVRVSGRFNVNNHAHLISSGTGCSVDWFFYFFQHRDISHSLTRQGAGRYKLTKQALEKLPVLLPSLPEQHKIAAMLRTWDEALNKLSALRTAKANRHVGLTNSLVFGGTQLEEFRGSNEVASHRWFNLPRSWGCHPIGELAMEVSERNTGADDYEVLSCSKYDGFVRSLEYFKKQIFSADLTGYKKIWLGDFGFPSNHVEEGSIGLQNLTETGVVSPIYTVFRFNPALVLGEFAFAVLKTEVYRHIFAVSTSASVDRRGSLRWKEFARLPFPLPPLAEQVSIAEVLNTSRSEIDALDAEIEAVSRQKRGLMQKLLTGEWRVRVSDNEEAAA